MKHNYLKLIIDLEIDHFTGTAGVNSIPQL